jgi:glycosyltransferase involved in cell wall biosynthesis
MKIVIIADGALKGNEVIFGSWIESLKHAQKSDSNTYYYLFSRHFSEKKVLFRKFNQIFISYKRLRKNPTFLDLSISFQLIHILKRIDPDVIHIYGTEFSHTYKAYIALKLLGKIKNTLLSIQGIVSEIANHYLDDIPLFWQFYPSLKDLLKLKNLFFEKISYEIRGFVERKLVKNFINIAGRTNFDFDFVKKHGHKDAVYFQLDELLRDTFYDEKKWSPDFCERNSIFISASEYPIKGLHIFLRILPKLIRHIPNIKVKIIGIGPYFGFLNSLKNDSYQNYLKYLLIKLKIRNHVKFIGYVNAEGFKQQLLTSQLFLLCSNIENSPNSLKEAIQLNVPSIAHNVGGVSSLIEGSNVITYDKNPDLFQKILEILNFENKKFFDVNRSKSKSANNQIILLRYMKILGSLK